MEPSMFKRLAVVGLAMLGAQTVHSEDTDSAAVSSGVEKPALRLATDVRRVTLIVRDLENSLKLYRDVMGLQVNYEWLEPPLPDPGPYPQRLSVGGHVIVTHTEDVDRRCAEAAKVPGVKVTSPPRLQQFPGRNGAPPIRVRGCNFFDPDGTLIELNQMMTTTPDPPPAGAAPATASPPSGTAPPTPAACDNKPVYMVVSGPTHDRARMMAYAKAIADSGLYQKLGGYYVNQPRAVATFEGAQPPNHSTLIVRFPCLANAQAFWYSKEYQERIKPLRLNPSAGDYSVSVYEEIPLREDMKGKVGEAGYRFEFSAQGIEQISN